MRNSFRWTLALVLLAPGLGGSRRNSSSSFQLGTAQLQSPEFSCLSWHQLAKRRPLQHLTLHPSNDRTGLPGSPDPPGVWRQRHRAPTAVWRFSSHSSISRLTCPSLEAQVHQIKELGYERYLRNPC